MRIIGWILSFLLAAFLILGSAIGKFIPWEGKEEMFNHIGYSPELIVQIGVLEIIITLLFLIPRSDFLGAILLTGYLGGAIATHVRVGDPYFFPIIIGIVVWIALALRRPVVFALAIGAGASK